MTKEKAMQYLNVLVALDETQIAKDTLSYFKQEEELNSIVKRLLRFMLYDDKGISTEEYDIVREWLNE